MLKVLFIFTAFLLAVVVASHNQEFQGHRGDRPHHKRQIMQHGSHPVEHDKQHGRQHEYYKHGRLEVQKPHHHKGRDAKKHHKSSHQHQQHHGKKHQNGQVHERKHHQKRHTGSLLRF
ncbi:histidine-rich glycoprotein [Scaptodrosophila lebanonensis]|uniref:Histidine-rich glycoprotein n=1 Tax=Drosophila lebanonensis TaxID=7225 RepID=A0A6J2UJG3_DROLE|nr:histidine-rich glycoprotein [Scaptodrosophila lebanonensis]